MSTEPSIIEKIILGAKPMTYPQFGPEVFTMEILAPNTTYTVYLHYFSDHGNGTTTARTIIYLNNTQVTNTTAPLTTGQFFTIGTYPSNATGNRSVMLDDETSIKMNDKSVGKNSNKFKLSSLRKSQFFFPKEETYGLTSQRRRAAISLPLNFAKGACDRTPEQFRNFLSIAIGSLNEINTQADLAFRIGYLNTHFHDEIQKVADECLPLTFGLSSLLKPQKTAT